MEKVFLKIKKIRFIILTLLYYLLALPVQAKQKSILDRLKSVGTGDEGAGFQPVNEEGDIYFADRLGEIIKIFLTFLAVVFLVLMIYGGFLWMTAEGNEQQVTKAKQTIINSTIGIIIVMLAYAITYFVVYKLGIATEFDTGL
ncbi:MAG: hypothetical protein GWO87_00620 [Xanthomonadaceae bacterium]|nr:hypothetical protein [Rhodospirillaceae bacterium]NIA17683.1 hypothetical protein [Xanthomonadaceae bacterium]